MNRQTNNKLKIITGIIDTNVSHYKILRGDKYKDALNKNFSSYYEPTIQTVYAYLKSLKKYINDFKKIKEIELSDENKKILDNLAKVGGGKWYNSNPRQLDENMNANGNFIYLAEAYMFFEDRINQGPLSSDLINCAKIHDGWAIARLIDWTGHGFDNYKSTQLDNKPDAPEYLLSELHPSEVNTLLKRGDSKPLIRGRLCNDIYICLEYENIKSRIRGDQLNMFVPFFYLSDKLKSMDTKFAEYIEENENELESLIKYVKQQIPTYINTRKSIKIGNQSRVLYSRIGSNVNYVRFRNGWETVNRALRSVKNTSRNQKNSVTNN